MTKGEGENEGKWSSRGKFRARRTALFKISFAICIVLPDRFLPFRASHSSATSPPPGYPINLKSSLGWYNLPSLFFPFPLFFSWFFFAVSFFFSFFLPCTCCHRNRFCWGWSMREENVIYLKASAFDPEPGPFSLVREHRRARRSRFVEQLKKS